MLLLLPQDPFSPPRADEHFAEEAEAARELGHYVAFIDHDAVTDPEGVRRVPAGVAVYRGWMLTSDQYAGFERVLKDRGVTMRTSAEAYRRGHELPGWYDAMLDLTPESVWGGDATKLGSGPVVIRDFVKSEKHYWDEAMFIPDVADAEAVERVVDRFLELRGDWLAGGVVFRRYEELEPPEVRTWWVEGRLTLVTPHPDSPDASVPAVELPGLAEAVERLDLPFISVDLMRSAGGWRVVEVGDGQVSDRPRSMSALGFLRGVLTTG